MSRSTLQREPASWGSKPAGSVAVDNVNGCDYVEGNRVISSWDVKSQRVKYSEPLGNRKMPSK